MVFHFCVVICITPHISYCHRIRLFAYTCYFYQTLQNRLKYLRPQFLPFFRFGALKSKEFWKHFCYRQLCYAIHKP